MPKSIVIGAGFSGLSTACHLAAAGFDVKVLEKNEGPGGRARMFETQGFRFDMGPSWYWMPEVFENFFQQFGKSTKDYYSLTRLDPSYQIFFEGNNVWKIPADYNQLRSDFERREAGSALQLDRFLKEAKYKYEVGMQEYVTKPALNPLEFIDKKVISSVFRMGMLGSLSRDLKKRFKHPDIIRLLEFPVLFLGATPQHTPALYSLMNYADIKLGTWYPMGGIHQVVKAMVSLAEELGVQFEYHSEVTGFEYEGRNISRVITGKKSYQADWVVGTADYRHLDQQVTVDKFQNYTKKYWESRSMAPSSLLFYIGLDKKVPGLEHHNLFFDEDFSQHADEIYRNPKWPEKPLFYVCCPSKTDADVAPEGKENLFVLIPLAPGLNDSADMREKFYQKVMDRLEMRTGTSIRGHEIYRRSYAMDDFVRDYHAFKGNAYGLSNTLSQTAFLKPKMKSKRLNNLFYSGQLTVPGPGVPPALISGALSAQEIIKSTA